MHAKIKSIICVCLASWYLKGNGQTPAKTASNEIKNSVYGSCFSGASLVAVNYERLLLAKPNLALWGQCGAGYNKEFKLCLFGPCGPPYQYFTIPHHVVASTGAWAHHAEFGFGGTAVIGNTTQPYLSYLILGYRYQPRQFKRKMYRIALELPVSPFPVTDVYFIPLGFSLGVGF